jgi:hypothetical protein
MNKRFAFVLVLVLASSSLIVIKPVQSARAKPSVPEFTVKLVEESYDVPTTYSIDPYTGENVTHPGHHVYDRTIELSIKNQPSTSYTDADGYYQLYYNVRRKGHFEENWTTLYSYTDSSPDSLQLQSDSEYTTLWYSAGYSPNAQIDFQVEAILGHHYHYYTYNRVFGVMVASDRFGVVGTSGWSDTQKLTIPAPSPAPTSTPKENPQTLPLEIVIGTVIAILLVVAGLLIYFKKRKHKA